MADEMAISPLRNLEALDVKQERAFSLSKHPLAKGIACHDHNSKRQCYLQESDTGVSREAEYFVATNLHRCGMFVGPDLLMLRQLSQP